MDKLDSLDIPYCVATASYKAVATEALKAQGLYERLQFIITCEEVGKSKTSPDIFLKAAELLGTKPCDTAVVEDAIHSVHTAKRAGFYTIGIFDEMSACNWEEMQLTANETMLF
jgi:HAD superfamily hydrolase (TIGR01509 family)